MSKKLKLNFKYLCREETTKDQLFGSFEITESDMLLSLISFDNFFFIKGGEFIVARLENNNYVTLFQNLYLQSGHTWSLGENPSSAYTQTISSGLVVVGQEPWAPSRPIRYVSFSVPYAERLLKHDETFDALARSELLDTPNNHLLEFSLEDMRVSLGYNMTSSFTDRTKIQISPRISIDFNDGRSLGDYLQAVYSITQFLSAACCIDLQPHDISIRELSTREFLEAVDQGQLVHTFDALYIRPSRELDDDEYPQAFAAFAASYSDQDRDNLGLCLQAWMQRDAAWSNAASLMMKSFGHRSTISAERLLVAFRWLEEIPVAAQLSPIKHESVEIIAGRAAEVALELGFSDWIDRIRGALRVLRFESHKDRFTRLVTTLYDRFGSSIVAPEIVTDLVSAIHFRGKVAHGHFQPKSDKEVRNLIRAIAALECLNYLLMLRDLPISEDGIKRIQNSRILSEHRAAAAQISN
jgi:hypothetical protein